MPCATRLGYHGICTILRAIRTIYVLRKDPIATLAAWKTFSTWSARAGCNLVEKVFEPIPTGSRTRSSKSFQPAKVPNSSRTCRKVFQQANVPTSLRTRRRKGSPTKQCCSKVEESSSKRFSNYQGILELVGKPFPQAGRNLSWLKNVFNEDS